MEDIDLEDLTRHHEMELELFAKTDDKPKDFRLKIIPLIRWLNFIIKIKVRSSKLLPEVRVTIYKYIVDKERGTRI
jgi:hypothetical protein